jgi:tetratricopeptide (TPR) repeat protein
MGFSGNNNIETLLAQIRLNPLDPALYLSLAQYYYDEGEEEKARSIVIRRREMATTNAMIHRGWGELCEDLGLARQALESYQKALRFNPNDEKTLLRLAELLADVGRYDLVK